MGALIRTFDWASTPVGAPETWPQSLRLAVRLMLNSQHPMFIWWGPELIQFYNDGYRQTMGAEMHPAALGAKGRESWADIWPIIGPQIEHVMAGKGATWNENQMVPIRRHGGVQEVWWTYGYSPIDLEGGVGGVLVVCTDVTEQHRQTEELANSNSRMAQLFEEAPGFIATVRGPDHVFELANAAYRKLIGGRDVIGKSLLEALPEVEDQGFNSLLDKVYCTGQPYIGRRIPVTFDDTDAGTVRSLFLDFVYQPIRERDGTISGIFVEGQDVTEHVNTEKQLALINRELQHRVKNMLAMVGAMANQTLRSSAGTDELAAFHARLQALATAQDALTGRADAGGELGDVIKLALAPHTPPDNRIEFAGPPVKLGSKQAVLIALAFHELATNAIKYGALSNDAGRVNVAWSFDPEADGMFHLFWRESGGPSVRPPSTHGFGSRLIKGVVAGELGGEVDLKFEPEGLHVAVSAPKASLIVTCDNT